METASRLLLNHKAEYLISRFFRQLVFRKYNVLGQALIDAAFQKMAVEIKVEICCGSRHLLVSCSFGFVSALSSVEAA
jgi:hypothetical protein